MQGTIRSPGVGRTCDDNAVKTFLFSQVRNKVLLAEAKPNSLAYSTEDFLTMVLSEADFMLSLNLQIWFSL